MQMTFRKLCDLFRYADDICLVRQYRNINKIQRFKCQSHKMVKHTQTIRRQSADELLECA